MPRHHGVVDTTQITGNGSNNNVASWIGTNSCPGVTRTLSPDGNTVSFNYGNLATGTKPCTFTVTPTGGTTLNGARITLTPIMDGTNFDPVTGNSAVLTVDLGPSAGHNGSVTKTATGVIAPGAPMSYVVTFTSAGPPAQNFPCGNDGGNLDVTSLRITDALPANFVYESHSKSAGLPGDLVYDPATRTFTYSDPTGQASCGSFTINGRAAAGATEVCNSASADVGYLDGFSHTITSGSACSRITSTKVPDNFLGKTAWSNSMQNKGQYPWSVNGAVYSYVYPGQSPDPAGNPGGTYWDLTAQDMYWDIILTTSVTNAGVQFSVIDRMPCMDNFNSATRTYDSRAPGDLCQNPAFIPRIVTSGGFTPAPADKITLVHRNGSTTEVAWTPGVGWVIPADKVVSEIRIPRFPGMGDNTGAIVFRISGHASSQAEGDVRMSNTATANAYDETEPAGSATTLVPTRTAFNYILIANPDSPSGTNFWTQLRADYEGGSSCRQTLGFSVPQTPYQNAIEIARAPSEAIYFDYLAPAGSTFVSGVTNTFRFTQVNSRTFGGASGWPQVYNGGPTYTSVQVVGTVTETWNNTGRPLVRWVIPAGTIQTPGYYVWLPLTPVTVDLDPGCVGLYKNDITVGYGAPIVGCAVGDQFGSNLLPPPRNPASDLFATAWGRTTTAAIPPISPWPRSTRPSAWTSPSRAISTPSH